MKRAFIIHGWTTTNEQDWIPWAVKALSVKGYDAVAPLLPDTHYPLMSAWQQKMEEVVGNVRPTDIFIGHSLGCQAILRFLANQHDNAKIDKLFLVAGAQKLSQAALPLAEDKEIFRPWRDTPINFLKVKNMSNQIIAIFSDDDPFVLLGENAPIYEKELGATIIVEHGKKHFMKDNGGVTELPILLQYI